MSGAKRCQPSHHWPNRLVPEVCSQGAIPRARFSWRNLFKRQVSQQGGWSTLFTTSAVPSHKLIMGDFWVWKRSHMCNCNIFWWYTALDSNVTDTFRECPESSVNVVWTQFDFQIISCISTPTSYITRHVSPGCFTLPSKPIWKRERSVTISRSTTNARLFVSVVMQYNIPKTNQNCTPTRTWIRQHHMLQLWLTMTST